MLKCACVCHLSVKKTNHKSQCNVPVTQLYLFMATYMTAFSSFVTGLGKPWFTSGQRVCSAADPFFFFFCLVSVVCVAAEGDEEQQRVGIDSVQHSSAVGEVGGFS